MRTERERWLDRRENVAGIYRGLWAACALLLALEPLVHKHGDFAVEEWFGFHGWFGFLACAGLVLAARVMRAILSRPEDYYDRR